MLLIEHIVAIYTFVVYSIIHLLHNCSIYQAHAAHDHLNLNSSLNSHLSLPSHCTNLHHYYSPECCNVSGTFLYALAFCATPPLRESIHFNLCDVLCFSTQHFTYNIMLSIELYTCSASCNIILTQLCYCVYLYVQLCT